MPSVTYSNATKADPSSLSCCAWSFIEEISGKNAIILNTAVILVFGAVFLAFVIMITAHATVSWSLEQAILFLEKIARGHNLNVCFLTPLPQL